MTRLAVHAVSAWTRADAASKGFGTERYTTADISSLCIFFLFQPHVLLVQRGGRRSVR